MSKKNKGFTLIELLIVIAIIGILAAIVLVSVRGVTKKAKDARITADVTQVRSQATIIYDDNGSYASTCNASTHKLNTTDYTTLKTIQVDIEKQQGKPATADGTNADLICYTSGTEDYCVAAKLVYKATTWFCIDGTGYAGEITSTSTCVSSAKCK
ncbi:prepilin-type N-terminal cleavage/methylation domain-containing protein [bacterium]|nr:prepilin-type N-terminal cleavage/methylation domain-containing protein [bacterium]